MIQVRTLPFWRVAHPLSEGEVPCGPYRYLVAARQALAVHGEAAEWGHGRRIVAMLEALADTHSEDVDHPSPWREGLATTRRPVLPGEYSGFPGYGALVHWFEGWLPQLDEAGFLLYRYDVPVGRMRTSRGGRQSLAVLESLEPAGVSQLPPETARA